MMKDDHAHLQLFDLIARDWTLASPAAGITFNADESAVAFACADGGVHIAATADKAAPDTRIRRAVDTGRLTIAPRKTPVAPLKIADFTAGRTSPVVPHGPSNFAFAKATGRINTLTPGGIAVHLPARANGPISAVAVTPDGATVAYVCGDRVHVGPTDADSTLVIGDRPGVAGLSFSPDGRTLAVAHDGGVSRWTPDEADAGSVETPLQDRPVSLTWRADGAWLAVTLAEGGFCVINAASNAVAPHGSFPAPVRSVAFGGPTDTVVASGAFRVAAWALDDNSDVMSGKPGLVLIDAVATCPSRNLVAVGYANGLLSLAEIGQPSEILLREDTGAGVTAMAWSANGAYLAVAGADGSAALIEFPDSMFKS
jgi:WD40 repeat protein